MKKKLKAGLVFHKNKVKNKFINNHNIFRINMKCRDGTNGHLWQIQDETYEWAYSNTKGDY